MPPKRDQFKVKDTQSESDGIKRSFTKVEITGKQNLAILISDQTNFKTKAIEKDKRTAHNDKKNPIQVVDTYL